MKTNYLRNVPAKVKEEVESLGLAIGTLWGGTDNPKGVSTEYFIQEENKDKIEKLKKLGWEQGKDCIKSGKKYTYFHKFF